MTITLEKAKYEKRGSRWIVTENPVTEEITREHYENMTDRKTLQFFRNLGGREIVERSYTCAGYVPVTIHSIAPDRSEKYIFRFTFTA